MKALEVARYFITLNKEQCLDELIDLSKLKLQKLLYYAQGYYTAMFNKPLFEENIEAWEHGPVVREIYDALKHIEGIYIPTNTYAMSDSEISLLYKDAKELIEDVFSVMGQYSAWKLRERTHNESPWENNYEKGQNKLIPLEDIKSYFKPYVNVQN
ncbi:Panacea domain-containing protein [Helicobacter labetoulli]|uniref:Panacea domain-containing protein n=1 Tax=Helicobacter labetoulli TaxID=2315333 RepID=UPI000EF70291|nr:type II toxin-antitoxin system antitoxin SocA domain-containing protein [Helicobacter labetoulli]